MKQKKKKAGKYLSPSQTKMKFKPVEVKAVPKQRGQEKLNCNSKAFKEFELKMRHSINNDSQGFKNVKTEAKRIWKKLSTKEKLQYSEKKGKKSQCKHPEHDTRKETLTGRYCICRQNIATNKAAIKCMLYQEVFHCSCVKFCPVLANLKETNYVCASCLDVHFVWMSIVHSCFTMFSAKEALQQ